ncbi:hypothetical protein K2Q00_04055 [Patescibacteria group bacterium]|nr:hypothetical protein [Patescibacteria group bacterium]
MSTLPLIDPQKLRRVYQEFPWLEALLNKRGFKYQGFERLITAFRVQRVDTALLARSPKAHMYSNDATAYLGKHSERLFVLDADGRPLVQVGMIPHPMPLLLRWWRKAIIRFNKSETCEQALARIGEGAARRARFIVSLTPVQVGDSGTEGHATFLNDVVLYKF